MQAGPGTDHLVEIANNAIAWILPLFYCWCFQHQQQEIGNRAPGSVGGGWLPGRGGAMAMGPRSVSPLRATTLGLGSSSSGITWAMETSESRRSTEAGGGGDDDLHHHHSSPPPPPPPLEQRLRTAAFEGKEDTLRRLVEEAGGGVVEAGLGMATDGGGLEIDAPDKRGWTALMYACRGGHLAAAAILVDSGASVHASNEGGWTPLLFAAGLPGGNTALVRFLVERGADPAAASSAGLTCAAVARSRHQHDIASLLEPAAHAHVPSSAANPAPPVATAPPTMHGNGGGHAAMSDPRFELLSTPRLRRRRHRGSSHGGTPSARRDSQLSPTVATPARPDDDGAVRMSMERRLAFLSQVPLLSALTPAERRRLARASEARRYLPGRYLARQG
jgi:hypothetical protein